MDLDGSKHGSGVKQFSGNADLRRFMTRIPADFFNDYPQNGVHCRGGPMCPPECRNVTAHVIAYVDVFGWAHRPSPTVMVNVNGFQ